MPDPADPASVAHTGQRPQSAQAWRGIPIALVALGPEEARVAMYLAHGLRTAEIYAHSTRLGDLGESGTSATGIHTFARIADCLGELFERFLAIVVVAPVGIVVRSIAPLIRGKLVDPAVVVVDAGARYAISLLSGHEGGANALAYLVSELLGTRPVVTTTSETRKRLIVGIGCKQGTLDEPIEASLRRALAQIDESLDAVRSIATIDCKRNEPGLVLAAARLSLPIQFVPAIELGQWSGNSSEWVHAAVGAPAVAEPAAFFVGARAKCRLPKTVFYPGVTIAIVEERWPWWGSAPELAKIGRDEPSERSETPK